MLRLCVPLVVLLLLTLLIVACSGPASTPGLGPIVPMSTEVAGDPQATLNELTDSERACVDEHADVLAQKVFGRYMHDLSQCLGDETILRWLMHPYGSEVFSMTTSTCIRRGAEPIDLRKIMKVGAPLSADTVVFITVAQTCMNEEEGKRHWGTATPWDADVYNREMAASDCVLKKEGGVARLLGILREHEDDVGDLVRAHNHEIDMCRS